MSGLARFSQLRCCSLSRLSLMDIIQIASSYSRVFFGCLSIWSLGYFRFSPSWLAIGTLAYILFNRTRTKRKLVISTLKTIGKDEKNAIIQNIGAHELPSWVYFPDVERAEWLNKIIKRMWPYITDYAKDIVHETVGPAVDANLPAPLKPFKFVLLDFGDTPLRVGGVKVYMEESIKRDEIVMDLDIMHLRGTLRVVIKPLVPKIPIAGAITVCFLDNPVINFLLTDMGNILGFPGLQETLNSTIRQVVSNICVLPNRIPIQLVDDVNLHRLKFPMPERNAQNQFRGVVRINVVSARDLVAKDVAVIGKNSSDPYCTLLG
ncbi:unnamed protein product [Protopolystoma xenopodis]|uniref:SMP-LTD domain-containing protein n=1 Tax=Protopolystoma xenopodis TaxID=117903 RepID=A0A3S5FBU3_9PLAT|nr:unnamed protein product [Protopolystoma xenopodis]